MVTVRAAPSAAGLAGSIQDAIDEWNGVLEDPRTPGLPRFAWDTSSSADVTVELIGGGNDLCGEHFPDTDIIQLKSFPGSCSMGANHGDAYATLVHEFLGVYGFQEGLEKAGVPGVSVNCVNHLPDDKTINSNLCQHEIEYILKAYGFRTASIPDGTNSAAHWGKRILTNLSISPTSLNFSVANDTTQLSVLGTRFENQPVTVLAAGNLQVEWGSSAPDIASVSQSGLVTAQPLNGEATITAKVTGGLPPEVILGGLMSRIGTEVPVTVDIPPVPPPPPGAGFRVDDITGPATPITQAGSQYLYADVVNSPSSSIYYRWQITYSNGVRPPVDETWTYDYRLVQVPEGSYTITVKVTPRSEGVTGSARIEDWPVCTGSGGGGGGGGGDLLRVPKPGGEVNPNAVGGC